MLAAFLPRGGMGRNEFGLGYRRASIKLAAQVKATNPSQNNVSTVSAVSIEANNFPRYRPVPMRIRTINAPLYSATMIALFCERPLKMVDSGIISTAVFKAACCKTPCVYPSDRRLAINSASATRRQTATKFEVAIFLGGSANLPKRLKRNRRSNNVWLVHV